MSPKGVEGEGVLVQQTRWAAEADPHEPPGPGALGGSGGAGGSSRTISISARAAERLASCASMMPLMRRWYVTAAFGKP